MNQQKDLIIFNMSPRSDWKRGIVNRNYHILQGLIASGRYRTILSVDFLPFNTKKKLRTFIKEQPWKKNADTLFRRAFYRIDKDREHSNVYYLTATKQEQIHVALKKLKMGSDLCIWSYDPFTAPILEFFPNAYVVFDAVDNWVTHPAYAQYIEQLKKYYTIIQKRADIIFTVSEGLVDFFEKKEHVFYIPNGVDVNHFAHAQCNVESMTQWNLKKETIIGYHGILQSRINFFIIEYLAQKNPQWHFVIIGPLKLSGWEFFTRNTEWKAIRETAGELMKKYSNIHFIGGVSYAKLPQYIHCFDAAIIPHKVDTFTHSMNPLKMYEYLACGKPIISTPVAGSNQFQDLVTIAVSPEDFSQAVKLELEKNSMVLQERRVHMAKLHSWNARITLMCDLIDSHSARQR